jgi:hypothetical protein
LEEFPGGPRRHRENARSRREKFEMVRGRPPRREPQKPVLFSRPSLANSIIKARSLLRDHKAISHRFQYRDTIRNHWRYSGGKGRGRGGYFF